VFAAHQDIALVQRRELDGPALACSVTQAAAPAREPQVGGVPVLGLQVAADGLTGKDTLGHVTEFGEVEARWGVELDLALRHAPAPVPSATVARSSQGRSELLSRPRPGPAPMPTHHL